VNYHKDLNVRKRSIELVKEVYQFISSFPKEELFGLTGQIRRAAVSIPSNIAEGAARGSKKEFKQFLRISLGNVAELETQSIIAKELGMLDKQKFDMLGNDIVAIRKMSIGLIRSLQL